MGTYVPYLWAGWAGLALLALLNGTAAVLFSASPRRPTTPTEGLVLLSTLNTTKMGRYR